jgi:hypothetical protein
MFCYQILLELEHDFDNQISPQARRVLSITCSDSDKSGKSRPPTCLLTLLRDFVA